MAIMRDEPDLGLAGLSIWVLDRQFPDHKRLLGRELA